MISFCHYGNERMASYRYRAQIPAKELGASINDPNADVLVFSKPHEQDIPHAEKAKSEGRSIVVDFCDPHFNLQHYQQMLEMADMVTCPTKWFAEYLKEEFGVEAEVIPDPYEFPEREPSCNAVLLWFGHAGNIESLQRVSHHLDGYELVVVSNIEGCIPWSHANMEEQFARGPIVLMPETAPYKSANRTVEAIRQGCFVVAEPHPSIEDIPGIWIGNIGKGIEWSMQNPQLANERTKVAQSYVRSRFSPRTLATAWRTAIQKAQSSSTSVAEILPGTDGSMSMPTAMAGGSRG